MHKIHSKEFTLDDFSHEHLDYISEGYLFKLIEHLNYTLENYVETKGKDYWWQMIQLLPSSYNQKRTVDFNYQTARHMYFARRNHKLDEWHTFTDKLLELPYGKELIGVI